MNVWDQMNDADPSGKGQYFEDGEYIAKITRCSARSGHKGLSAIVEFEVAASTGLGAAPPGSHRSFVRNCSKPESLKMAMGDLLAILEAACNVDDRHAYAKEVFRPRAGAMWDRAIGPNNPLADKYVAVSVFKTKTKAGNDFSIHRFGPVTPGVNVPAEYKFATLDEIMAAPAASSMPATSPAAAPGFGVPPGFGAPPMGYGAPAPGPAPGPLAAPPGFAPSFPTAPAGYGGPILGAPPAAGPPPQAVDPAKARALATPGWTRPDGSWWNGAGWVNG